MKICSKCKNEKELDDFYPSKKTKDGYNIWCKVCNKEYNKQFKDPERRKKWREDNKEYNKSIHKKYYLANKEKMNLQSTKYLSTPQGKFLSYKNGARRRKINFNLTQEEFNSFWQKDCYYCGDNIQTIGIDRVKSELEYNINNCVPCCYKCNQIKMDMNPISFLDQIEKIYKNKEKWKDILKLKEI